MAQAAKIKPARDWPSMNAIHAVRGSWDVANKAESLPLTRAVWTQIGHIPANAHILTASMHVTVGALAAGATLDVSCGETSPTELALVAGAVLDTPGQAITTSSAGMGYRALRRIVWARLTSAADLTAGKFHVLIQYYSKQD